MPPTGRTFSPELITNLISRGVQFAPLILHTGVASLEGNEPPYEEYYRVSPETAKAVNTARQIGKRVVAVGTTLVRALETVTANGLGKIPTFFAPKVANTHNLRYNASLRRGVAQTG
jgi:S-adenosylmethionine:tRNA ribosyltransferase-isomerase